MGRPPGVKNGSGNHGTKNGSKSAASGATGNRMCKASTSSIAAASGGGGEKIPQDRSQSNFPYDIRLNGYTSLHNAVTKGTPRIKRILTEECDYIMECRVCRNLFRSLPNFITHKMNYCKKAFDSTWCIGLSNLINSADATSAATTTTPATFDIEYEVDPELVLINPDSAQSMTIPKTRSVADLYNELVEKSKVQNEKLLKNQASIMSTSGGAAAKVKSDVVRLQVKPLVIPGDDGSNLVSGGGMKSVVVQQRIISNDPSSCDNASSTKQGEFLPKDTAILGPDGKVLCTAPGKGIEQVVSRLTAQLKALEEKEAQRMAAISKNAIICDVCKTVFDSEKSLRQHKRESLDCGKTWGFKSPNHDKYPAKARAKRPSEDDSELTTCSENATSTEIGKQQAGETVQSVRQYRFISPPKSRRSSHHHPTNGILTSKSKRSLSLSPVKKIKMKYIKFDSSSNSSRDLECARNKQGDCGSTRLSLSCSRCSSSFTTRHEMSMHLALCTGVINQAYMKESEPPPEKIRISLRNGFPKPSDPVPVPMSCPSLNSIINSESQHHLSNRQRQISGTSSNRDGTPTVEVNNNKQYKNDYQQNGLSGTSSSEEDDTLAVVPVPELEILSARLVEDEGDSDITSHDSGVSSSSSTRKKLKFLSEAGSPAKRVKAFSSLSSSSFAYRKKGGASSTQKLTLSAKAAARKGDGGMISERPESKKTFRKVTTATTTTTKVMQRKQKSTAFNLRKAIISRVRKSRRNIKSSPQQ